MYDEIRAELKSLSEVPEDEMLPELKKSLGEGELSAKEQLLDNELSEFFKSYAQSNKLFENATSVGRISGSSCSGHHHKQALP